MAKLQMVVLLVDDFFHGYLKSSFFKCKSAVSVVWKCRGSLDANLSVHHC